GCCPWYGVAIRRGLDAIGGGARVRAPDRVAARKGGTAHHDIRAAHPDERGPEGERVLESGGGDGIGGKPVRMPRPKQPGHLGERGAGSRTLQELDDSEPLSLDPRRGGAHALVGPLGEHDAAPGTARPLVHRVAKRHLPNFFLSALCTTGWTSCDTSPPKRATSRTRLELR